jgi:splicing factor 3B subunit 3
LLSRRADACCSAHAHTQIHQETYGKSGARRIVPGQYLAVDPKGRAVMIAAVEKSKLVYVLNRDTAANLTISSPLEAHKSHTLCFALVALDMGCARMRVHACARVEGESECGACADAASRCAVR